MKNQKKKSFPRRVFLWLLAILLAVCIAFGIYVSDYYRADPAAEDALVSDRFVSVTEQNGNWVFAPESPTAGLIFYPGGKVETTAAVMPGSAATVRRRAMAHPPSLPRNNSGRRRTRWRHG